MKKVIDVVELRSIPLSETEQLLGWNVDVPVAGTQTDATTVEFRGWVVGKTSPVIAVEVVTKGRIVKTLAVNVPRPDVAQTYPQVLEAAISGFQSKLDLSKEIENTDQLILYAILRDQSLIKMAEVTVQLGLDFSTDEIPLPQQAPNSEIESIQLKLQRIQADLERSKVFVQKVKTDLQNRPSLNF